jgi:hypothetical protein
LGAHQDICRRIKIRERRQRRAPGETHDNQLSVSGASFGQALLQQMKQCRRNAARRDKLAETTLRS